MEKKPDNTNDYGIDFINPFTAEDESNEQEEDIAESGIKSIGEMAISGTDWTTETIVRQIEKGNIVLDPEFQRRDAWDAKKKSRFIESLLLGFPIPQIILAETKEKRRKFIVIDGKQRLLSLQQFMYINSTNESALKLIGLDVRKDLNGKTYKQMIDEGFESDIDSLSNQPIRTVVLKNWPSVEMLYLIFLRLNTGSVKLSPQELRQALYPGEFINFANEFSAKSKAIKSILKLKEGKADFRMRDVEIFIRYMAFQFFADKYNGSMQTFLDDTCNNLNQLWENKSNDIIEHGERLDEAYDCAYSIFNKHVFCKFKNGQYESRINRAIMDILLYYFSDVNVRNKARQNVDNIKSAFEKLSSTDEAFMDSIEQTTKSIAAVTYRFNKWAQILEEVLSIKVISPLGMCDNGSD